MGATSMFEVCTTHGPWGGSEGAEWVYKPPVGFIKHIKITVRHGSVIDSIEFETYLRTGETVSSTFGGKGGNRTDTVNIFAGKGANRTDTICIDYPDEYLKSIAVTTGYKDGSLVVKSICFTTNRNRYGPFGTDRLTGPFGADRGTGMFGDTNRGTGPFGGPDLSGTGPFGGTDRGTGPFGDTDRGTSPFGGTERGNGPFGGTDRGNGPFGGTNRGTGFGGTDRGTGPFGGPFGGTNRGTGFGGTDRGNGPFGGTDRGTCPSSTNRGTDAMFSFNTDRGTVYSNDDKGGVIVGFHGRANEYLNAIGVYVMPESLALGPDSTYGDEVMHEPCSSMSRITMPRDAGPWGAGGGKPWDDGIFSTIKQIRVHEGELNVIYALQFKYLKNDGNTVSSHIHGGTDGVKNIHLVNMDDKDEYLIGVSGFYGPVKGSDGLEAIASISFHTNKRIHGPFGDESRVGYIYFSSPACPGKVAGFHGRSNGFLSAIGVHMEYF